MLGRLLGDLVVWWTRPRLVRAAIKADLTAIRSLLASGVDVDVCDRHGRTALMEASRHGNLEMVLLLLQHGADAERKSASGKNAHRYGATIHVMEVLRRHQTHQGVTVDQTLAIKGNKVVTQDLGSYGAAAP